MTSHQVHLTYWTSTSVLVSWVTCDAKDGFDVTAAADTTGANIAVTYGPVGKKGRTAKVRERARPAALAGLPPPRPRSGGAGACGSPCPASETATAGLAPKQPPLLSTRLWHPRNCPLWPSPQLPPQGVVTSYFNNYASVSKPSYASGVIHHVLLKCARGWGGAGRGGA